MKWKKISIKTNTEAEDIIISTLYDIGLEGAQIEDKIPLTAWEKEQMFVDILPDSPEDDGVAYLNFFVEVNEENDKVSGDLLGETTLEELLTNIKNELEDLRFFMEIGEGTITVSETEDKDWINNWKQFFHQFYVDDLFISMYMTRFVTRKREGHKDRTNDTRVFLFGLQGIVGKLRQREPKESREVAEFVSCLRAAMLQRSKVEVATNSQMMALWTNTAVECVRLGHLEGYFNDTYGLPIERIDEVQNVVLVTT